MGVVLLIEDDRDIRRLLQSWLENSGHQVEVAEDGGVGLESARSKLPDAIICDIMMPGLDGFEVLSRLREDPSTARIPIMMLSARDQEDEIIRALEAGAADYVVKPFSPREVIARLDRILTAPLNTSSDLLLRKLKLIERFARTARGLQEIRSLRELWNEILDEALEATSARRGTVMTLDGNDLIVSASRGMDRELESSVRVAVGEGIAGRVAQSGTPLLVQDITKELLPSANPERYLNGSLLSLPIRAGDRTIAVLNVNTKAEQDLFSADDLEALQVLADLAALAASRFL